MRTRKNVLMLAVQTLALMGLAAPALAVNNPMLIVVGGPTFVPGDTFTVKLDVANLAAGINAAQALIRYDSDLLTLQSIAPALGGPPAGDGNGSTVSGASGTCTGNGGTTCVGGYRDTSACSTISDCNVPWTQAYQEPYPTQPGDLVYGVSLNQAGAETSSNHTIATLTFLVIEQGSTSFTFWVDTDPIPYVTKLVKPDQTLLTPMIPGNSGGITLECDDNNACTKNLVTGGVCDYTTPEPSGTFCGNPGDGICDLQDTCNGAGACTNNVEPTTTTCDDANECTSTTTLAGGADTCDGLGACDIQNVVNGAPCATDGNDCTDDTCQTGVCTHDDPALARITLNVQVDALSAMSVPLDRDVMVDITTCGPVTSDFRIVSVTFDNGTGIGTAVVTDVDINAGYISVRTGHSLSRQVAVNPSSAACNDLTVDLTGANKLVSGDWSSTPLIGVAVQDNLVDITDFSILATVWGYSIDPWLSHGADADGDGLQNAADFTTLVTNFLLKSDPVHGCGTRMARRPDFGDGIIVIGDAYSRRSTGTSGVGHPLTKIQLSAYSDVEEISADLDGNGVVDVDDMEEFAFQVGVTLPLEFKQRVRAQELNRSKRTTGRAKRR